MTIAKLLSERQRQRAVLCLGAFCHDETAIVCDRNVAWFVDNSFPAANADTHDENANCQDDKRQHGGAETNRHISLWSFRFLRCIGHPFDRQVEPDCEWDRCQRTRPSVWPRVGREILDFEMWGRDRRKQQ